MRMISRMNPHPVAPLPDQQLSRGAAKRLPPPSTKSDPMQNFIEIFKIPLWRKKNYVKLVVKTLFK